MSRASQRTRARERREVEQTNERRRVALAKTLAHGDPIVEAELLEMDLASLIVWKNTRPTLPES